MVTLRAALEAFFREIIPLYEFEGIPLSMLRAFWKKDLTELTLEEWADTIAVCVYSTAWMNEEQKEKLNQTLGEENPVKKLLRESKK